MTSKPIIRVAYADYYVLVRKGIVSLLADFLDVSVDIEADNGYDLIIQISNAQHKPDVCILDINMPVMNGFDTLMELKKNWPEMGILVLTASDMKAHIMRMILNGANGYLLKNCNRDDLYKAISSIYYNGMHYSEIVTKHFFNAVQTRQIKLPKLTEQELVVMKKCCSDLSYAEIAKELGTTTRSVEGHRDSLFKKLNVNSRVSLALYAVQIGLVPIEKVIPERSLAF